MSFKKLTIKKVEKAIEGSFGNKSVIAKKCNCTWQSVYEFFNKYPELEEKLQKERDNILYLAENKLLEIIVKGDIKDKTTIDAVLKVLNSKIAKGEWQEKQEIINKNLNVNIDINEQLKEIVYKIQNGEGQ